MQKQEAFQALQFDKQYRIPFNKTETWRNYLKQNGFVVIKKFISSQITLQYLNQIWQMMQTLSLGKLKRNDIQSQKDKKNYPSSHHNGLMQYIGHANFQWELRKHVKPIFQQLWQSKNHKLKTSFDGVSFMNGLLNFQHKPENSSLHVDQPPIKKGVWSYQGIMAITDADDNGGGFVVVPKSHKYFNEYFKLKGLQTRTTSYNLPEQQIYTQPFCNYIKVNVQAGDFILFQSRTFHSSTTPTSNSLRVATYICMMPQQMVPPLIQKQRQQAFRQRLNSGHHCGDGFRTFGKLPKKLPKNKEDLNVFQQRIKQINRQGDQKLDNDMEIRDMV